LWRLQKIKSIQTLNRESGLLAADNRKEERRRGI